MKKTVKQAKDTKALKAPKPPSAKVRVAVPDAGDFLGQLRSMKGVELEDFSFFTDEFAHTGEVKEHIPTGSLAIDRLINGGWPVGRFTEVAAWEGVGKSTLIDQTLAQVQRMGGIAVLIESEAARDSSYMQQLGVDLDKLILLRARHLEEGFFGIDRVLSMHEANSKALIAKGLTPPLMFLAWDSLGATPPQAELEGSPDDVGVGQASRIIKRNFRRIAQRMASLRLAFVFTNHFYEGIGPFASLKTPGGSAIRYFCSVRLWLTRTGQLKVADNVVGHSIEAKLKKTKINRPRPPAEIALVYGSGIHNSYTLFEWGKTHGLGTGHRWVKQAGAWSYFFPDEESEKNKTFESFQHSFIGLGELFSRRMDYYQAMVAAYIADGGSDETGK